MMSRHNKRQRGTSPSSTQGQQKRFRTEEREVTRDSIAAKKLAEYDQIVRKYDERSLLLERERSRSDETYQALKDMRTHRDGESNRADQAEERVEQLKLDLAAEERISSAYKRELDELKERNAAAAAVQSGSDEEGKNEEGQDAEMQNAAKISPEVCCFPQGYPFPLPDRRDILLMPACFGICLQQAKVGFCVIDIWLTSLNLFMNGWLRQKRVQAY